MRARVADVLVCNKTQIDEALLQACPSIRLIVVAATGVNNIALQAAAQRNILVCNCVDYGKSSVAQHVLMLMLNLATNFLAYRQEVTQGRWQRSQQFCLLNHRIVELAGSTLGIVGFGALGRAVAQLAQALVCE